MVESGVTLPSGEMLMVLSVVVSADPLVSESNGRAQGSLKYHTS